MYLLCISLHVSILPLCLCDLYAPSPSYTPAMCDCIYVIVDNNNNILLFQELGFFGGKTVLRKQFGEAVDDDSKKSTLASGASAWNERRVTCNNPNCRRHGYGHHLERSKETHPESSGGQYKSRVSNAYGVTEDLVMDSDEENVSVPVKKSKVPSNGPTDASSSTNKVVLKPRRQPSQQYRYMYLLCICINKYYSCRELLHSQCCI